MVWQELGDLCAKKPAERAPPQGCCPGRDRQFQSQLGPSYTTTESPIWGRHWFTFETLPAAVKVTGAVLN